MPDRLESGLVPALIQIARKQERTIPGDGHLATKGFDGQRRKRNFGGAVWSLRVRDSDDRVQKVRLILLHRSQFLVDSQSSLRNDLHGVFRYRYQVEAYLAVGADFSDRGFQLRFSRRPSSNSPSARRF